MKAAIPTTAERWRRHQRDLQAYRRRSLWRRSHARFIRDLAVLPHGFLAPGAVQAATLRRPADEVLAALRQRAVWTLDTASRLACGRGFLTARDLTGYITASVFGWVVNEELIEEPRSTLITVDPVVQRPRMLIVHLTDGLPPFFTLPSDDRVVTWDFLVRDIVGTIGWRPDLLARIEDRYRRVELQVSAHQPVSGSTY